MSTRRQSCRHLSLSTSAAFLIGGLLAPAAAGAGTQTATMTNTVTVSANCSVSATGFSTAYDPINANASTPQDASATVTTTCSNGTAVTIALGQGANASGGSSDTTPLRRLSSGGGSPAYLDYVLYKDSARTSIWGNTAATGTSLTGTGAATTTTVYARVPAAQTGAREGSYTDSVLVTVSF